MPNLVILCGRTEEGVANICNLLEEEFPGEMLNYHHKPERTFDLAPYEEFADHIFAVTLVFDAAGAEVLSQTRMTAMRMSDFLIKKKHAPDLIVCEDAARMSRNPGCVVERFILRL